MTRVKNNFVVKILSGSSDEFSLEQRLFNVMILLLSMLGFFGAYHNLTLGLNMYTVYPSVVGGILCIYFYYLSRVKKKYSENYVYVLVFTAVTIISIVFFNNSGSAGPIVILHLCLFNIFILISNGRNQLIILSILLINVSALYFIEYKFEGKILHYSSNTERFWDVLVTFLYSTIFMVVSTIIFKKITIKKDLK